MEWKTSIAFRSVATFVEAQHLVGVASSAADFFAGLRVAQRGAIGCRQPWGPQEWLDKVAPEALSVPYLPRAQPPAFLDLHSARLQWHSRGYRWAPAMLEDLHESNQ